MSRPRLLIFDLDGTLVDTMGPSANLFSQMLAEECGIPDADSRPVYTRLMGKGPKAQFAAVLESQATMSEAFVNDLTRRYWERDEANVAALFPEVLAVLEALAGAGHTLIVSSGSIPRSVERKIRTTGIDRLFRIVLGSDEDVPGLAKGAGHFALIRDALGLSSTKLSAAGVFIGDGVYDMQVAREASLLAVGRLTGANAGILQAAGADHVIDDLRGLPPLLDAL